MPDQSVGLAEPLIRQLSVWGAQCSRLLICLGLGFFVSIAPYCHTVFGTCFALQDAARAIATNAADIDNSTAISNGDAGCTSEVVTVSVRFNKKNIPVDVVTSGTVADLKRAIERKCRVPVAKQTLLCGGRNPQDESTLAAAEIKTGTRMLLLAPPDAALGAEKVAKSRDKIDAIEKDIDTFARAVENRLAVGVHASDTELQLRCHDEELTRVSIALDELELCPEDRQLRRAEFARVDKLSKQLQGLRDMMSEKNVGRT
eukprot:gnl/TRDRNA2_/TRDRNA2_195932_c0_seq1.p1 gnl/TRDRNA2_/TRDRNA2_195932_c0~~gnl/TRDRNA2_/TRDRNA2_195932_c0_seq1.p1  ORF type:complete len:259 (+),score=37.26 gnl/TRDRNA2_/TRDRNA2_195932_c0_seq1:64-840(+)